MTSAWTDEATPRWRRYVALGALGLLLVGAATHAAAQTPTPERALVAVYLPSAPFASNADRSAYARVLADAMTTASGGAFAFEGRAFAKRQDLRAFLGAGKVDVLVADGLFVLGRGYSAAAHGVDAAGEAGPKAALYVSGGVSNVEDLRGKTLAMADVGGKDFGFFSNTVLAGELVPDRYFGKPRRTKDAASALGALRAGKVAGAFAPAGHPSAGGLTALLTGGRLPIAVAAILAKGEDRAAAIQKAALGALTATAAGRGGGIAGWRRGGGPALADARSATSRPPKVTSAGPVLAASPSIDITPPRLRLEVVGSVPAPSTEGADVMPVLEEEPLP